MQALGPKEATAGLGMIACGDTVTTDVTLTADLVDCPNNGLIVGADGITIDLNGHAIDGDGTFVDSCPKDEFCDIGVVSEGHSDVTIKGGRVKGFGLGVLAFGGSHIRLLRVNASHNIESGIVVFEAVHSAIKRSATFRNGLHTDQAGMAMFDSRDISITRTSFSRNGDIGLFAPGNDHVHLWKNKLARNPEAGILMDGDNNLIARNRFARNGDGLALGGNDNVIRRNRIVRSKGCDGGCGLGVQLEAGKRNVIVGNTIRHPRRMGLSIAGYGPIAGVVVARNTIRDAGKDGIRVVSVSEPVSAVELRANLAVGSADDGIDVDVRSATLTRNVARRNREHGISAVEGVTDGGGNRASGNGSEQCKNVACA